MVFGKKASIKDTISFSILNGEKTEEMSEFVLIFSRETSLKVRKNAIKHHLLWFTVSASQRRLGQSRFWEFCSGKKVDWPHSLQELLCHHPE